MMKKIHLLPNAITAFGLSCGLFVICRLTMLRQEELTYPMLLMCVGILILAGFADLFDGAVARMIKAESDFGGIFDSLSDALTFGAAPTVLILKSLEDLPDGCELAYLLTMGAMVFAICGVLRLARFSSSMEGEIVLAENRKNKTFTGLPIPAACMAATSANLLFISPEFTSVFVLSACARAWIMLFLFVVLGYFMISRWKFPSLKSLHVRVASFQLVFLTVLSVVLIFYGLLHHFPIIFALVSWTYIITAWVLSCVRLIGGKKSQLLIDYEPEEFSEE